jgi:8-oxo-dGTP diphosphatase
MTFCYEYERPSLTVDIIVLSLINNFLNVLLIQRKNEPYKNKWALPGGFVNSKENIRHAAIRELKEETGLKVKNLNLLKIMNIKTDLFKTLILFGFKVQASNKRLVAGDDASDAKIIKFNRLPLITFSAHKTLIKEAMRKR